MGPLAAKVAASLGFDVLLGWVIRLLIAFVVGALIVALIVVQIVAGVLTGGKPGPTSTGPGGTVVAGTPIAIPAPTAGLPLGNQLGIVQLAQAWLGVPYVFGGCTHAGVDCSCLVENVYAAAGIRCRAWPSTSSTQLSPSAIHNRATSSFSRIRTNPVSATSGSTSATASR